MELTDGAHGIKSIFLKKQKLNAYMSVVIRTIFQHNKSETIKVQHNELKNLYAN